MSTEPQTGVTLSAETPSVLPPEQAGANPATAGTDKPAGKDKPTPKTKEKPQDNSMGIFGALFNVKGQGGADIADQMKKMVNDPNGPFGQVMNAFQTILVSLLKPFLEKMGIDVSKLGKDEPVKPEKTAEPEKPQVTQRKVEAPAPEPSSQTPEQKLAADRRQYQQDMGNFYASLTDEQKSLFVDPIDGPSLKDKRGHTFKWGQDPEIMKWNADRREANLQRFEKSLSPEQKQQWTKVQSEAYAAGEYFKRPNDGIEPAPQAPYESPRYKSPRRMALEESNSDRSPGFAEKGLGQSWNKRTWDPGRQPDGMGVSKLASQEYSAWESRESTLAALYGDRVEDPGKLRTSEVAPGQDLVASMTMKAGFAPG